MRKSITFLALFFSVAQFLFSQDIDTKDVQAVAKFYAENFYTGNYAEATKVLVTDGRANGIEIRCIEMGECEIRDSFEYKLYGEKVVDNPNEKALLIFWTETSYIQISLEKQSDGNWLVIGSPSRPSAKAKEIKG